MKKGLIFDCDGVLLDSMEMWESVASTFLKKHNIIDDNVDDICSGMSLEESSVYLNEKYNLGMDPKIIRLEINCIIEEAYYTTLLLKEGVEDFLKYASSLNYKMIIATATPKPLVVSALKRLGVLEYFMDVITTIKVKKSKSFPDIYDYCLMALGLKKEDVYVFEDIYHAIKTLKDASYDVIGVLDRKNEYIFDMGIKTISSFKDKYLYDLIKE